MPIAAASKITKDDEDEPPALAAHEMGLPAASDSGVEDDRAVEGGPLELSAGAGGSGVVEPPVVGASSGGALESGAALASLPDASGRVPASGSGGSPTPESGSGGGGGGGGGAQSRGIVPVTSE